LVGSSSSSRSLGQISARASCSRMRQPPEKLFTGRSSCVTSKPKPSSSAWARACASWLPASRQALCASASARPSPLASAVASAARAAASRVSPSMTKAVASCSVSGMSWATAALRQWRGSCSSPLSSCRWPCSSANRLDLPAPLRPTRPIFSPGLSTALAPSSTTLGPRRSVIWRRVIMVGARRTRARLWPGLRPASSPVPSA